MSYAVGRRFDLDLAFLWLWCRLVATALSRPLLWEPPYVTGMALKRQKDQKKKFFLTAKYMDNHPFWVLSLQNGYGEKGIKNLMT